MLPLPPPNSQKTEMQKTEMQKQKTDGQKGLGLGFRQPQATMREFVILLILLFGSYTALHLFIPSNSSLSLFKIKSTKTRSPILEQVGLLKDELRNKENTFLSQLNQTTAAKDTATQSQTPKDATTPVGISTNSDKSFSGLKVSNENSLLTPKTIEKWKEDLIKTNISEKEKNYLTDLSSDFSALLKQLENKDIKKENLSILFLNINKNLVNFESSLENSLEQNLFWTGNGKWLEVVFWSLIGTLLYIIQQTSEYYLSKSSDSSNDKSSGSKVLIRRKPQYYYFLFQSPFTALVILWILSMANLNIAGIALALSSAPSEVLISLAFILGLYNRVANTQLNLIVKGIFGEAWTKTVRKIEIKRSENEDDQNGTDENLSKSVNIAAVLCGKCTDFDVLPDVKVKWTIISIPSAGIIDKSTGTYIAPPKGFYYENAGLQKLPSDDYHNYTQDIIRAEREDEPDVSALLLVILVDQAPIK